MKHRFDIINLNLKDIDLTRIKGDCIENFNNSFFNYTIKDWQYLNSLLENRIEFRIKPDLIVYTEILLDGTWPHRDTYKTTLNYYIASEQAQTWFFEPCTEFVKPREMHSDKGVTYAYDCNDVKVVEGFCAENHQAYLLNTDLIHAVQKEPTTRPRQIIRWLWQDIPYVMVKYNTKVK